MIPTFVLGLESVYPGPYPCIGPFGRQMVGRYQFAETHQQRRGVGDAFLDVGLEIGEGVRGDDACRAQRFGIELVAAAYRDNRDACRHGCRGDARGGLAVQGLLVEGAFARHHEISLGEPVREADQLEHQLDAGPKLGAEDGQRGEPGSARRTRAGVAAEICARWSRRRRRRNASAHRRVRGPASGVAPFCGP